MPDIDADAVRLASSTPGNFERLRAELGVGIPHQGCTLVTDTDGDLSDPDTGQRSLEAYPGPRGDCQLSPSSSRCRGPWRPLQRAHSGGCSAGTGASSHS